MVHVVDTVHALGAAVAGGAAATGAAGSRIRLMFADFVFRLFETRVKMLGFGLEVGPYCESTFRYDSTSLTIRQH